MSSILQISELCADIVCDSMFILWTVTTFVQDISN